MQDKELKIYDIITQWLTYYEFNFSQLGKVRNEEEINKLNVAKKEVKDLEKFTRLVIEKAVDTYYINECDELETYNEYALKNWGGYYTLTEKEFNFIKEMIKKYGK